MSSAEVVVDVVEEKEIDLEGGHAPGFVALPTGIVEDEKIDKTHKDISWTDVNFRVGNKVILSDCWGEVRFPVFSIGLWIDLTTVFE